MDQVAIQSESPGSVFRTRAWVQAWIDTWGSHPKIQLIDLGGRKDPLEQVYIASQVFKKCLPIKVLNLAGVGSSSVSTPRAEYIDLMPFIQLAGNPVELARLLMPLKWQRFNIPDVLDSSGTFPQLQVIAAHTSGILHRHTRELAYSVVPQPWPEYVAGLGANTRLAYINRRKNLLQQANVEQENWPLERAEQFFTWLNQFHCERWANPCYSLESQKFLKNFGTRLIDEGGCLLFRVLRVNGQVTAVLLDIQWRDTCYNLQSGFLETSFPKIALGSLHMGYDIEQALQQGLRYDFMAGQGKHSNYKERIATCTQAMSGYYLERGIMKNLRQFKQRIFTSGNQA